MSEKYIRQNKKSNTIVKNSKTYAKIDSLDDAIVIRDLLVRNDWDLDSIPNLIKHEDNYLILSVLDEKIYLVAKYKNKPDEDKIDRLVKKHKRNPNNSKYGLNIARVFDTYVIKKQIAGDDYVFGYYDNLCDAEFVRNFLMDHNWNVNEFETINYCEDTKSYVVVHIIDDKVYVLDSFNTNNIDLKKTYEEFLSKISKHKYGLAMHPHLDDLKDKIEELEDEFGVKTNDGVWSFDDISSPLNDIVFNLIPFQQSVFDAIGDESTFDDVKKALIRYKSKNFDEKIDKNLNELIELNLIKKEGNYYKKIN